MSTIVSCAVASRAATIALLILANELLPTHDATGVHKFRPRAFPVPAGPGAGGALAAFTRWDAAWFLSIADSGYPLVDSGGDTTVELVDCAGTERTWGGEDYDWRRGEESERRRPRRRCSGDVPLEEQAHAFFPLYPWVVRYAAAALRAVALLTGVDVGESGTLVFAAVAVSNACFVAAAVLLHRLGLVVTGDSLLAFRGALAFCATPASVFFSTAYTESLFAALSFAGLLVLFSEGRRKRARTIDSSAGKGGLGGFLKENPRRRRGSSAAGCGAASAWIAAGLLSLATLTRSNGIAAAGVLVLEKLRWMADEAGLFTESEHEEGGTMAARTSAMSETRDAGKGGERVAERRGSRRSTVPWLRLIASAVATALQTLLVVAPYVLVQVYAYDKFCRGVTWWAEDGQNETANSSNLQENLEKLHPWCAWRMPSLYAYVQSAYWGVGALKYYHWKQIPNFLLAAPTLILTATGTVRFFSSQLRRLPSPTIAESRKRQVWVGRARRWARWCPRWVENLAEVFLGAPGLRHPASPSFERSGVAALVLQWGFLGIFAAVCMNVQVATRFLAAACPPLHWWIAGFMFPSVGAGVGNAASRGAVAASLRWYLVVYFVVGSVLHANFLPWT